MIKFKMEFIRANLTVSYYKHLDRAKLELFNDFTAVTDPVTTDALLTVEQVQELIDNLTELKRAMTSLDYDILDPTQIKS